LNISLKSGSKYSETLKNNEVYIILYGNPIEIEDLNELS
jgi:hypothetical protein